MNQVFNEDRAEGGEILLEYPGSTVAVLRLDVPDSPVWGRFGGDRQRWPALTHFPVLVISTVYDST
jgi:hypothetical protein